MSSKLPQLFVKTGCPWCAQATDVLDRAGHKYQETNVTNDSDAWDQMKTLSGQTKAPVLDWNGDVLADFGAEELVPFLKARGLAVPS
jgi:glutaredoxin 3